MKLLFISVIKRINKRITSDHDMYIFREKRGCLCPDAVTLSSNPASKLFLERGNTRDKTTWNRLRG